MEMVEKFSKMNPIIKDLWTTALESKEYVQGQRRLCRTGQKHDEFCCLGVLGNVLAELGYKNARFEQGYKTGVLLWVCDGHKGEEGCAYLPVEISEACGLSQAVQATLAGMNDGNALGTMSERTYTFPEIAKWIKENL